MNGWQPEPRQPEALAAIATAVRQAPEWLIVTHERPDGDALGSALAVGHILSALGKPWTFVVAEEVPDRFRFLPKYDQIRQLSEVVDLVYPYVIAVDCADEFRFVGVSSVVRDDAMILNIDHHQTNPRFGRIAYVDDHAAATCELIFHLARALDVPLDTNLATCLYTGILTDTGGFSYPNTTREIHQIAAELLASGVQPYDVAEPALEARTRSQMQLFQMALRDMVISDDGRYAMIWVTQEMLSDLHATDDDAEGLVAFARSVDTVEIGVLLRERADGTVKVSLRSKRQIDVAEIAQHFGGGGHARAAGCVVDGPMADARLLMEGVVKQVLEGIHH
jgi:bifunctional oligoribonuclease and PAP phosphatase NrnA